MIFEPYSDELEIINEIHKYNENEYVVIRLTHTMIGKNNIDANGLLRDLLEENGLVSYDQLKNGGKHGEKLVANLIFGSHRHEATMNFYKVNNIRSDRRFSIYGIKKLYEENYINEGDLLYITVSKRVTHPVITVMNTTRNVPTIDVLVEIFGIGKINESLSRLIPLIQDVSRQGYHPNSKGEGKISPKDSGDTLEHLLGIKTNNSHKADFEGVIEIKAKTGKTLDTLFTLRPRFDGTPVAEYEPNDRSRVSAFARMYGYNSEKRTGYKSLYITIGTEEAPQNSLGFYLEVNEESRIIELRKKLEKGNSFLAAYWDFDKLETTLQEKHPATLWVKAKARLRNGIGEFKYKEAELSRSPQFTTFLSLIKSGGITYDWRGYTTPKGKYQGKNHGNAWRIRGRERSLLFGSMEKINLN